MQLLPSVWGGSTARLQEGSQAQLHVPWAPGCKGQWRNLVPTFWAFADCSWVNPGLERRQTGLKLGTACPVVWWQSPPPWSLGVAAVLLPQVLYPSSHQCFRKAVCLQVCHTPRLELMPTPAASADLGHCKQESAEKCPSCGQAAKSPGERGGQSALSFLTPLNSPLPQSCACWDCSKMFPRAFPEPLWCLSTVADDIPRATLILVQEAIRDHYTSNLYPNIGLKITNRSSHMPLHLNRNRVAWKHGWEQEMPSYYALHDENVARPSFPHKKQNTDIELEEREWRTRSGPRCCTAADHKGINRSADARRTNIPHFILAGVGIWFLRSFEPSSWLLVPLNVKWNTHPQDQHIQNFIQQLLLLPILVILNHPQDFILISLPPLDLQTPLVLADTQTEAAVPTTEICLP